MAKLSGRPLAVSGDVTVDSPTLHVDSDNDRVGVGTTSPDKTLSVDGDFHFQPTAITTAHLTTAGSLRIRADDAMYIGDDGADSIRIGRTNTALAKIHLRSGSDDDLVVSGGKVGIGMNDPSDSLEIDGDIQLSPTAITTAHVKTAGSLKIRATGGLTIGDDGADSVKIGRINTALAKIHLRSGSDDDLVVSDSKVGIGTNAPDCMLHVAGPAAFSGPSETFVTFDATDTTPSVAAGNLFKTHASGQTLTMFDDGVAGQTVTGISPAAVVFDVTSTNLKGGSADITTASGDITTWTFDGTNWYLQQFMDVSADHSSVGGSGASLSGSTDNTICTVTGANAIQGEANLKFDGSALTVTGAQFVKFTSKATADSPYTVAATDYYIGLTTDGAITVNLPAVSGQEGRVLFIKDVSGAAGTNNITIEGSGSETIDGQETQVINTNFASITLICSDTTWSIV